MLSQIKYLYIKKIKINKNQNNSYRKFLQNSGYVRGEVFKLSCEIKLMIDGVKV